MKTQNYFCLTMVMMLLSTAAHAQVFNPTLYYSFDNPDNYAAPAIGTSNLEFYDQGENGQLGTPGTLTAELIDGPYAGKKAITIPENKHIKVLNTTLNGETMSGVYSLLFDIKCPPLGKYYTFYQTDLLNANDGELFLKNSNIAGTIGTQLAGYSTEALVPDQWYRIILTLNVNGTTPEYRLYSNGNLIHSYNGPNQDDYRFLLGEAFWIFSDNDHDDNDMDCAGFAFWGNKALTPDEVSLLGPASNALITGIDNGALAAKEVIFYPNPVNDIINFDATNGAVSIYDLLGRKVFSTDFQSGKANISSLKPGTYVIRIWANDKVYSSKLIKQ
jgi:hypothetical protein